MTGWIKLHRKLLDLDGDFLNLSDKTFRVAITILLKANFKNKIEFIDGSNRIIGPGQLMISREKLLKFCGPDISEQNLKTCIAKLQNIDFLTKEVTNDKITIYSINNWVLYQAEIESTNNLNDNQPTTNQRLTNALIKNGRDKNAEEVEERKEDKKNTLQPDSEKPQNPEKIKINLFDDLKIKPINTLPENKIKPLAKKTYTIPEPFPEHKELAELLKTLRIKNDAGAKITGQQTAKNADQVWYMINCDNREIEQIRERIIFSQQNEYWQSKILSMKNLRDNYDSLTMQLRRINQTPGKNKQAPSKSLSAAEQTKAAGAELIKSMGLKND